MEKKKIKIGLVPKLIIAIIVGILFGQFLPEGFCRFVCNPFRIFSSTFLKFVIPLMILAYVTMGICGSFTGCREASPDHSGSGLWLHSDRRFRILSGIIQPVPALYE